jgi:hypothetical protein
MEGVPFARLDTGDLGGDGVKKFVRIGTLSR